MLQDAIDLQNDAVKRLVDITYKNLLSTITFKAPTGSGKTYMMAKFISEILSNDDDVIFLVSSLSKGGLAKQNYDKFIEYALSGNFTNIKPYLISSDISGEERLFIPTSYNVYCLPLSLDRKGGNILKSGAFEAFLKEFANGIGIDSNGELVIGKNKKIYLIKDECHIATNNLDKIRKYFSKVYNFSATPKLERGQNVDVEITNEDAQRVKLIKTIISGGDTYKLQDAINKFKEIKEDYINKIGVNPCMIIQISNKDKADDELAEIKPILNENDLKWILIVDKEKECDTNDVFKTKKLPVHKWKEYAKSNSSNIDVIIFKLAISEGWDIPRACMLYQKRDVKSPYLTQQVVGRVRRNPRLLDYEKLSTEAQKLAMSAWVWGDIEKSDKKVYGVKIRNKEAVEREIRLRTTRIKKLINKADFDLQSILDSKDDTLAKESIFTLYRRYKNANQSIQELCNEYSTTYQKWFNFNENIDEITTAYNKYICNYDESMEVTKGEDGVPIITSLPISSYYLDTDKKVNISNCVWVKLDETTQFAFDSDAERDWVDILKDLCTKNIENRINRIVKSTSMVAIDFEFLWGKNYLPNSEIKYEYYLNGRHFSYPDFVLKDSFNNIHIFEVKSVNKSNKIDITESEYNEKVQELKKLYTKASELTGDIFYLPLQKESDWQIIRFKNGVMESPVDLQTFIYNIKNNR